MKNDILAASALFTGKCVLTSLDYKQTLIMATEDDLICMDPPYQGTFVNGGFRYYGDIKLAGFIDSLQSLHARKIPFILSYDGRTGNKTFGEFLPSHLELTRIEVDAGRSSQATLLGRNHITYESVYLSKALVQKLDFNKDAAICKQCYWGSPEKYLHIALKSIRRLDIQWEEHEIKNYERLKTIAKHEKTPLPDFVKRVLDKSILK